MIRFSPRFFILPLLALVVIGSLPAPANTSTTASAQGCGPAAPHVAHAPLRAAFGEFDRRQSAAAAQICAVYHNSFSASR